MGEALFKGFIETDVFTGMSQVEIGEEAIYWDAGFEQGEIGYHEIVSISYSDYKVKVESESSVFNISKMGQEGEWFFNNMQKAFYQAIRKAFHAEGNPLFKTNCMYLSSEGSVPVEINVFENCICILSSDQNARRIPFVFLKGIENEKYSLRFIVEREEDVVLTMLGFDLDLLEKKVFDLIKQQNRYNRLLREKISANSTKRVLSGIAFPLNEAEDHFSQEIKKIISKSKMKETVERLLLLGNDKLFSVGIMEEKIEEVHSWILWGIIPSKDEKIAIVEFAFPNQETATSIFRIETNFFDFLYMINRAMEAVDFKREGIFLGEDELRKKENANLKIIIDRTPILKKIRSCFLGRVIHRSLESWEENLKSYL